MRQIQNHPTTISNHVPDVHASDNSSAFFLRKMITYMDRLLASNHDLDKEAFDFLYFILNRDLAASYVNSIKDLAPNAKQPEGEGSDCPEEDSWSFANACRDILKPLSREARHQARVIAGKYLEIRSKELEYEGSSSIESNILEFRKIFHLNDLETELCVFLFVMSTWNEFQNFFENHLMCNYYQGRRKLAVILNCGESQLVKALSGKLDQIGILQKREYRGEFELEQVFRQQLVDLSPGEFKTQFIKPLKVDSVPLESHMIDKTITRSILARLSYQPETSTHILLYGPPGTGKTSYAQGIAERLGLTCYQLVYGSNSDEGLSRKAAITASVNLASETDSAILVADDCDSILNTRNAWSLFGETHDKRWLHEILEKPVVRMIWIANTVDRIEESVARRFSFSVNFKPFNRRQRVKLWQNVAKKHEVEDVLKDSEIEDLASRFDLSVGVIDQAVRKVAEASKHSEQDVKASVILALESHVRLQKSGFSPRNQNSDYKDFTLEGLNLSGTDPHVLLEELAAFDLFSKNPDSNEPVSMSLLFHGPPGTGKSALAKFIAAHLEKEIVFKRASDVFSKWVGETEKNIRDAYEEAYSKEAVLIFDEADSLIFNRDRADHSWELSFTNEFLTWMESFQGIQIFTTNRLKDMDNASLRRFSHKIEFGYLKPEGNAIFYGKLVAPLITAPPDSIVMNAVKKLSGLAPGDFKSVRDRFAFRNKKDITHETIISALADEARLKDCHAGVRNIGFLS
jgi:transitional endoplasmic reticulum ATPase